LKVRSPAGYQLIDLDDDVNFNYLKFLGFTATIAELEK